MTKRRDQSNPTPVSERLEQLETLFGLEETLHMSFHPELFSKMVEALELVDTSHDEATAPSPATPISASEAARIVSATPNLEDAFSEFEIIGQGGMGVVFKARQANLERSVAIKVVRDTNPENVELAIAEARVMGRLDHANIATIHQLGREPGGAPRLIMKLVDGETWRDRIHRDPSETSLREHLEILLKVCDATAFAHDRGILHRDLKPENVMVGAYGQVFVMDWGLALALGQTSEPTAVDESRSGCPVGTPIYMSPELALGEPENQDERTDVYLLGACLHEALTGQPRHRGSSLLEVVMTAVRSEPYDYLPEIPRELAELCNEATAAKRADRPGSVASFRSRIQGYLLHEQAHRLSARGSSKTRELEEALSGAGTEPLTKERIEALHEDATFSLRSALEVWPGSLEAKSGLRKAHRARVRHALAEDDLERARALAPSCEDPALTAEVAALEARLSSRALELEQLRQSARELDWRRVALPLAGTFIFASVAIGIALALVVHLGLNERVKAKDTQFIGLVWIVTLGAIGGFAALALRKAPSFMRRLGVRIVGTWGTIAFGCLFNGMLTARSIEDYGTGTSTIMLGLGFAITAFQTRLWLLAPAVFLFVASVPQFFVAASERPLYFGVTWCGLLFSLGIAFWLKPSLLAADSQASGIEP